MNTRTRPALIALPALLGFPILAHAISLAPGQTLAPDLLPFPPNTVQVPGSKNADFPAYISATSHYWLTAYQDTNTLDTSYITEIHFTEPLKPLRITLTGYQGVSIDAGYMANALVIPTSVSRSVDGDTITWTFDGLPVSLDPTNPDTAFAEVILQTNSKTSAFADAVITFTDDNPSNTSGLMSIGTSALAPHATTAPVPELSSLSLLTLATAGFALRFRRRLR